MNEFWQLIQLSDLSDIAFFFIQNGVDLATCICALEDVLHSDMNEKLIAHADSLDCRHLESYRERLHWRGETRKMTFIVLERFWENLCKW